MPAISAAGTKSCAEILDISMLEAEKIVAEGGGGLLKQKAGQTTCHKKRLESLDKCREDAASVAWMVHKQVKVINRKHRLRGRVGVVKSVCGSGKIEVFFNGGDEPYGLSACIMPKHVEVCTTCGQP
jgi:hypothetical protein